MTGMGIITFSPLVPIWVIIALALIAEGLLVASFFIKEKRALRIRSLLLFIFAGALCGPVFMQRQQEALSDKLLVIMDRSESQTLGGRDKAAEKILQHIKNQAQRRSNLELEVIDAGKDSGSKGETDVFSELNTEATRIAATVLITDGQVHDVPRNLSGYQRYSPFHVLLTGKKDEYDRKVTLLAAPAYGVTGQEVALTIKVEGTDAESLLHITQDGRDVGTIPVLPNTPREFKFKINHAGQNVFEFALDPDSRDLTASNDRAAVIVNGVRDRLKVLLVSGAPHMGERAWRNLLKSDPSIDLVHFTILRSPMSFDPALPEELSLIAFPADELFLKKIEDFDLIIFDRFSKFNLIDPSYVESIKRYIDNGGGLLFAMATGAWAEEDDRGLGPLADILPLQVIGTEALQAPFVPQLTEAGKTNPITSTLTEWNKGANWGAWQAQRNVRMKQGDILLSGAQGLPLLITAKAGQGRIAALASDHIWIWSKGGAQSGPYLELLRNLSHWLMQEPELESGYLKAEARGMNILIARRQDNNAESVTFTVTDPSGKKTEVTPDKKPQGGWIRASFKAETQGVHVISDGTKEVFAAVGNSAVAKEWRDVKTTADRLSPFTLQTGGGILWLGGEENSFALRDISPGASNASGTDWIGITRHKEFQTTAQKAIPVTPPWAVLLILLCSLTIAWMAEGRKNR